MCLLNRYSAQTEYSPTGSPEAAIFTLLTMKQVLPVLLLSFLFSLAFILIVPPAFPQEKNDSGFQESLEEDPLAELDADLGLAEDPLAESDADL
ncbi:MAG TPA: hypothetical protein EYN97_12125, partial [Candidatus Lambdaproteobacteria bacterium]|nr:hypothetical protein [Candidatus Lambdaproteobacteria bacterium]